MRMRVFHAVGVAFVVSACASLQAKAQVFENTSHRMTAADFFGTGGRQAAFVRGDGTIQVLDFTGNNSTTIALPGGETALKIIGADAYTGTFSAGSQGITDLAIVTSASTGLRTYDFASQDFTGVAGSGIQDITATNLLPLPDVGDEVIVSNTSNGIFLYNNGAFSALPGAGSALAAGQFNGDTTGEFVITGGNTPGSGTGIYPFDGEAFSFTTYQAGGGGINRLATGNLVPGDAADEVYLTNTSGNPYVTDGAGYVSTTGSGTEIGIGKVDADLGDQELAYIIGGGGIIYQSNLVWGTGNFASGYVALPVDPTDDPTAVGNNFGFIDLLVADVSGDGLDELIALRPNDELFVFQNGFTDFVLAEEAQFQVAVPEPSTLALWLLLGIAFASFGAWRRKLTARTVS